MENNSADEEWFQAVKAGDDDKVKLLVEQAFDVNAKDNTRNHWTALHYYAEKNDTTMAEFLITNNADIEARSGLLETPLLIACRDGGPEISILLLNHGADVNAEDKFGNTPKPWPENTPEVEEWFQAVRANDYEKVKQLVEQGFDCNSSDKTCDGMSALHYCVELRFEPNEENENEIHLKRIFPEKCYKPMAELLVANGANIDAGDFHQSTPLMLACLHGNREMYAFLVERGADVNAKDESGATPLQEAAINDEVEIVKMLLEHPKFNTLNDRDCQNKTALQYVIDRKFAGLADFLRCKGAVV